MQVILVGEQYSNKSEMKVVRKRKKLFSLLLDFGRQQKRTILL
jgi:hypothetical protein